MRLCSQIHGRSQLMGNAMSLQPTEDPKPNVSPRSRLRTWQGGPRWHTRLRRSLSVSEPGEPGHHLVQLLAYDADGNEVGRKKVGGWER